MTLQQKRAAAFETAQKALKAMEADPTEENVQAAEDAAAAVEKLDEIIEASRGVTERVEAFRDEIVAVDEEEETVEVEETKSLGKHFVKHAGRDLMGIKGRRASVSVPEYKAVGPITTGGVQGIPPALLADVDRSALAVQRRPMVTDLFGQGTLEGQAITYFVEGPQDGEFAAIAEAGKYPQAQFDSEQVVDALAKIGGFIKLSDEMIADLDFLVSEIDGRLLYSLALAEEAQVLAGDGTGANLKGLLNRDGVQTGTTDAAGLADEIYKSITKISNASGLQADSLVINPADYEALRLGKDTNGQYYGGGYFAGQYGQGGVIEQPPVWGLRTVVSPAVEIGTAAVGAFKTAATLYTKGGVAVEATNANEEDFVHGLVTVRGTKRVALAVRKPAAFVKLTIS